MVRQEYELSAAQLLPEVSSGPNHGSHFQEKRPEVFLIALQQPGGIGDDQETTMASIWVRIAPKPPSKSLAPVEASTIRA